jgi:hypothetical protein
MSQSEKYMPFVDLNNKKISIIYTTLQEINFICLYTINEQNFKNKLLNPNFAKNKNIYANSCYNLVLTQNLTNENA